MVKYIVQKSKKQIIIIFSRGCQELNEIFWDWQDNNLALDFEKLESDKFQFII